MNNAQIVDQCAVRALYQELKDVPRDQWPADAVVVEAVANTYVFRSDRLRAVRPELLAVLREVAVDPFLKGGGGGWSFVNLAVDREGTLWANHRTLEALCALAIGAGLGEWCLPVSFWGLLPGGVPYICFDLEAI